ncbi:MAG: serine/threonine-protein phosphatase [Melioribacteraceae bacterium]|nr:serine/threonine-protein phosphatase [Melioribacteraceae bacterium]
MLDPKTFYRKLDSLLSKIGSEKSGKDFLLKILTELENTFGYDLKIGNGRIYQETDNGFQIISNVDKPDMSLIKFIDGNTKPIKALLKSCTYIFDNPSFSIEENINSSVAEYRIPAAISIKSPNDRWLFIFDLKSGWIREEVEFCLNAVRTAIDHRLFSDSVKSELKQAAHIQQSLLPSSPPQLERYSVAAKSIPAELVGGDLYDYFDFDDEVFGFCVGDASGHGLPAALLVRDVVTGLRMGLEKHLKLVYTFEKLNSVIYRSVFSTSFISIFYGELEKNGNIVYVNAGHPSPIIYDGEKFTELESTGLVFGALPEIEIHRGYAFLPVNAVLVLYSDGIIERKNRIGDMFVTEELKKVIAANYEKDSDELLKIIFDAALEFGFGTEWEDDATVMVIKRIK